MHAHCPPHTHTPLLPLQPYKNERDEKADSGIVVPLLPFGIRKYDEGERFDLRSPYSDDGWVDPEEVDALAGGVEESPGDGGAHGVGVAWDTCIPAAASYPT
jgi:hypothetical protein